MHATRNRRGTVYVAVMATAFIVSFVGLAGLTAARLHLRSAGDGADRRQASLLAAAAIEHAVAVFQQDSDWRVTTWEFNREYPSPPVAVNGGSFTWRLVDLGNGRRRLDGIGRVAAAESIASVDLGPRASPFLECALICNEDLTVGSHLAEVLAASGAPVCTNATLQSHSLIIADVEAQSLSGSGLLLGERTIPADKRLLPDATAVFDYYLRNGTLLDTSRFSEDDDELAIHGVLLSPYSNPYGTPNPEGIYIVDCRGRDFELSESRVVGTLVVLDPRDEALLRREVNLEPAFPHYPALLVRGDLRIRIEQDSLRETDAGTNLNPDGTPWKGETDSAVDDSYPSALGGIVYASGDIRFDGNQESQLISVSGVVICGRECQVRQTARVSLVYDPLPASNPPPGFDTIAPNAIVPGTWRRTPSE